MSLWRCLLGESCRPLQLCETSDEEWESEDVSEREDSVYRFYYDNYETRRSQLCQELAELESLGPKAYAEQCSVDVTTGARSQEILTRIKDLRRELRLCLYRTLRSCSAFEPEPLAPVTKPPEQQPMESPRVDYQERPLPDWIIKGMENREPLTPQKQQRLQIQAASSVLTLAGRVLSVPSAEIPPRYFEIFNLHENDTPRRAPSLPDLSEKHEV